MQNTSPYCMFTAVKWKHLETEILASDKAEQQYKAPLDVFCCAVGH